MGRFSRKIKVKLVDDRTDTVIDIAKIPPESLPESFFASTTMHRGDAAWAVVSADPMTRGQFSKTGQLVIRMRPVEPLSEKDIL